MGSVGLADDLGRTDRESGTGTSVYYIMSKKLMQKQGIGERLRNTIPKQIWKF